MKKRPLFLGKEDAEKIHEATLQVLEKTGIWIDHKEAIKMLLSKGAKKDADGRILIPRKMVEEALDKVNHSFTLYDRNGNPAIDMRDGNTYFTPGSDAMFQIDRETGKMRDSKLEDVRDNIRIADALGFDLMMSMALPREVEPGKLYPTVFAEMIRNTARPIITTLTSLDDIKHIHEISLIVCGGRENFRPFFLAYLEPVSPLRFNKVSIDRLFYCADNDIPFMYAAGSNCGTGAPVVHEGGVVQGSAESLGGLVIAVLRNEKVKFVYGSNTSISDMRSAKVCYGAPGWPRTVGMFADMGKFYDLPTWGAGGSADAMKIDAQAAWEAYRSIIIAVQTGATLVHNMGYMSFGELYDSRMLVLVMEMLREVRFMLRKPDLSDESLSVDVIDEVARSSSLYLAHPQTAKKFRKSLWISRLINRTNVPEEYEDVGEKLRRRVEKILSTHKPDTLSEEIDAKVRKYLDSI